MSDFTLRLERAAAIAAALESQVESWCAQHRGTAFRRDWTLDPNEYVIRFHGPDDMPESWGIAISDCLHNLRASLDSLAYALALAHTPTMDEVQKRGVEFPIFTLRGMSAGERRARLGCLDPGAARVIDDLQPSSHSGGDTNPLALLHDLSNVDRHRHLHALAGDGWQADILAVANAKVRIAEFIAAPRADGDLVTHFWIEPIDRRSPVDFPIDFSLSVCLSDGPAAGMSPTQVLREIHDYIATVVFPRMSPYLVS